MHVELHANIELPADVVEAKDNGATGIGLFRSEFLFLNRADLPDEDEQFEAYRKVAEDMDGPAGHDPHLRPGRGQELRRSDRSDAQPGARPAGDPPLPHRAASAS